MRDSPRHRRLKSDLQALQQLAADSSILDFTPYGTPPDFYVLRFRGRGFGQFPPSGEVLIREQHEVHVRLCASYPRLMPDLAWKSPIFHPNISQSGVVCLGGYGTFWVPSLTLCDLCVMLWDMARYANFDEKSPYNREAAAWAKHQNHFPLPIDNRPLRDKLSVTQSPENPPPPQALPAMPSQLASPRPQSAAPRTQSSIEVAFMEDCVEAQIVETRDAIVDSGVFFIE